MANKLILEKKAETVKTIASKISESAGVVFIDYRGLTDEEFTSLRKNLRENNADVKVYKNTLTKRALDSLNITLDECVVGPSALVYSTDAVSPIKVVTNFAKDHEALSVKGGLVDGKEVKMEVKEGDQVIYSKYSGTEVELDGEEYLVVKQNDILAIVK